MAVCHAEAASGAAVMVRRKKRDHVRVAERFVGTGCGLCLCNLRVLLDERGERLSRVRTGRRFARRLNQRVVRGVNFRGQQRNPKQRKAQGCFDLRRRGPSKA